MENKDHTYDESHFESCADSLHDNANVFNTSEERNQSKNFQHDIKIPSGEHLGMNHSSWRKVKFGSAIILKTAQILHNRPIYRDKKSFHDEDFEVLRNNIKRVGINVEPITVKEVSGVNVSGEAQFELVQGGRRLQACADAGVNVSAIICNKPRHISYYVDCLLGDAFKKKLSPYEYGLQLQLTLAEDWVGSDSDLALLIGIDKSKLSRSLALANLPSEIIEIVSDARKFRVTDGSKLQSALKLDNEVVMQEVLEILKSGKTLNAKDVVKILLASVAKSSSVASCNTPQFFIINNQNMGQWHKKKNGSLEFKFAFNVSNKDQAGLIKNFAKILKPFAGYM